MTASTSAHTQSFDEPVAEPISLHHFVKTLGTYRVVIFVSLAALAIAYVLVAAIVFLASPTQRVTSQPFRLDFEGASSGKFPNGLRFSTADIVSATILLPVYRRNDLQTYVSFPNFSRSVFVLESNRAYDVLTAEYQARLADPRLTPVDRERVQREYEQKRDAIAKNAYSLNYIRLEGMRKLPEPIIRKVLADILSSWSDYAIKNQDVLAYRIAVLSPEILATTEIEKKDPMIAMHMLRARTVRLLDNLSELQKLPGAELARAGSNQMSLAEVRVRMEEFQRYRIEPLVTRVRTSGAAAPVTVRFLQDQLDYDQRQLAAARKRADSLRDTLALYEQGMSTGQSAQPLPSSFPQPARGSGAGETVMPQLSDTFIDRIVDVVRKSGDAQYRQQIANDYRGAMETVIPLEQAVAYDTALLQEVKSGGAAGSRAEPAAISAEIETSRNELHVLAARMNEIYREISRNVYSTSQLVTVTAPPSTRIALAVDVVKILLWGIVVMLIALPLIVIACLLHNRVREEEEEEQLARGHA